MSGVIKHRFATTVVNRISKVTGVQLLINLEQYSHLVTKTKI